MSTGAAHIWTERSPPAPLSRLAACETVDERSHERLEGLRNRNSFNKANGQRCSTLKDRARLLLSARTLLLAWLIADGPGVQ